jgi:hypothetical protein
MNRGSMSQQVRKPPMKKPVKKKAIGGALGALAEGDIRGAIPGVLPMMLMDRDKRSRGKRDDKKRQRGEGPSGTTGMKKGGKVGRGDGACMKGRTKGKMV